MEYFLPHDSVKKQFLKQEVAKIFLLNKISFCSQQIKVGEYPKQWGFPSNAVRGLKRSLVRESES